MLSAVLSTSTASKISKQSSKKPRKALPATMSPDAGLDSHDVAAAMARGNKKGRMIMFTRRGNSISKEKLESTLGCRDIVLEIMSNFRDQELLDQLMNYLCNFPDLVNRESCLPILLKRRVWYCNSIFQLQFIHECLKNQSIVPNTELVMGFPHYSNNFTPTIEKFSTVHLNEISITKRQLVDLMNASTSKIEHLKFTNFEFSDVSSQLTLSRKLRITPNLKKLSFKFQFSQNNSNNETNQDKKKVIENPIFTLAEYIDLMNSNIDDLSFSNITYTNDFSLITLLGPKLKRLKVTSLPRTVEISTIAPNLEYFESLFFPKQSISTNTLSVNHPSLSTNQWSGNVKKIISRGFLGSTHKEVRPFFENMVRCYSNCEELIIPETFLNNLSKEELHDQEITNSLKRIIVKHSNSTQPSKYGALKFALQFIFPSVAILSETIQKEEDFETLDSSKRTINIDCYEDTLFKRIESTEKHFKVMDNSLIKQQIKKIKRKFIKCIISNDFTKFRLINESLDILEGLKRNKQLMLQTIHQAIENYHDIFAIDPFYLSITEKFDNCLSVLEEEYFSELEFSKRYHELEVLFHQMIQVIEENGYPSKVLFNEQWFNEQIVEIYGLKSDEVQVYQDSQEEMEKACLELMLDEENYNQDAEMVE